MIKLPQLNFLKEMKNMYSKKFEDKIAERNRYVKKLIDEAVDEDMNSQLANQEHIGGRKFNKTVKKLKKERNFENGDNETLHDTIFRIENSQNTISELMDYCEKMKKSYEYILGNILYCDSLDDKFDGELYADCIPYSQVMLNRENNKISKLSKKVNEEFDETDEMVDLWRKEYNVAYFGSVRN